MRLKLTRYPGLQGRSVPTQKSHKIDYGTDGSRRCGNQDSAFRIAPANPAGFSQAMECRACGTTLKAMPLLTQALRIFVRQ